jgi:hypothetical protein
MSGYSKKTAQAFRPPGPNEPLFELPTVIKMLPLVRKIADDLLAGRKQLAELRSIQSRLERHRKDLSWPERRHRYQVQDSLVEADKRLRSLTTELESLGIAIVDRATAQLGFPTIVNNRLAFFSWIPGEETVTFWHYDGEESRRRPIPEAWYQPLPLAKPAVPRKG